MDPAELGGLEVRGRQRVDRRRCRVLVPHLHLHELEIEAVDGQQVGRLGASERVQIKARRNSCGSETSPPGRVGKRSVRGCP